MFRLFRKSACDRTRERLSPYLDGQLLPRVHQTVAEHLEQCEACRAELDTLRATLELLHRMPTVPAPRSFALREVHPAPRRTAFAGLRVATALVTLLLAALVVGDWLDAFPSAPSPPAPTMQEQTPTIADERAPTTTATVTQTVTTTLAATTVSPLALSPTPPEVAAPMEERLMAGSTLDTEKAAALTPSPTPLPTPAPTLTVGEAEGAAEAGPGWPLRQLEYGLLGASVTLAAATFVYWRRFRPAGKRS